MPAESVTARRSVRLASAWWERLKTAGWWRTYVIATRVAGRALRPVR